MKKTVQEYIDETPLWSDGTTVPQVPMTIMQWQIWGLATAGKFFEGLVVLMTGVALPLIAMEFGLGDAQKGMVGSATLFGILIGATALGSLADHLGRKQLFIAEMILFLVFLVAILFPVLLSDIGTGTLLYILVGTSLAGAFVTWRFGIETMGVNLENIGRIKARGRHGGRALNQSAISA